VVDRSQLADFLRTRREALQPEDVGLARGPRRRTEGLRREEVALLAGMSADYYGRLEQARAPQPSEQMLQAIAQGLRLSLDERDHLFRLAGHNAPARVQRSDHIGAGIMRILDRLQDTPAQVMSALGETLLQTPLAVALLGDETRYTGLARSKYYRWFMDPEYRDLYPYEDHPLNSRTFTALLRAVYSKHGPDSRAGTIVDALLASSDEFVKLWSVHEVGSPYEFTNRINNAEVGPLELNCQTLLDPEQEQSLLVFTAAPGSESYEKLQLLAVIGAQKLQL
jgi:transcriptional regulator with XRE-family HTH domain